MPVAIIGMHRSGTSMVARMLNLCGLYLGPEEDMLGATDSNEKGHWEHRAFLDLNEEILVELGGGHLTPPYLPTGTLESWPRFSEYEERVKQAASDLSASGVNWGWKEPRTSLFMPLYSSAVPGLQCVICIRNPLDVAGSLAKRNGISVRHGVLLWHYYTVLALRDTGSLPRRIVHYNQVLENPLPSINALSSFCGLTVPSSSSDLQARVLEHADTNLNHHQHSAEDVGSSEDVPSASSEMYAALAGEGSGYAGFFTDEELLPIHQQLAQESYSYLGRQAGEVQRHYESVLQNYQRLLEVDIPWRNSRFEELQKLYEELRDWNEALQTSYDQLQSAFNQRETELSDAKAEAEALRQALASTPINRLRRLGSRLKGAVIKRP